MTFTREMLATLNTLMADHGGQELLVMQAGAHSVQVFAYDAERLILTARVDDLGGVKVFEWMGATS